MGVITGRRPFYALDGIMIQEDNSREEDDARPRGAVLLHATALRSRAAEWTSRVRVIDRLVTSPSM